MHFVKGLYQLFELFLHLEYVLVGVVLESGDEFCHKQVEVFSEDVEVYDNLCIFLGKELAVIGLFEPDDVEVA
jgi:hypothetical protein